MGKSLLDDPKIYQSVIADLALGIPQVKIAQAYGVTEQTIVNWKKRKDVLRDLSLEEIRISREPIEKVKTIQPLAWLERKFREHWAPPKGQIEGEITIKYSGWDEQRDNSPS